MAILCSGRLEIIFESDHGPVVGGVVNAGAALGELALLTASTRSASIRATRDSELLVVGREIFERLLEREPSLAGSVVRNLGRRLQASVDLDLPQARTSVLVVVSLTVSATTMTRVATGLADALRAAGRTIVSGRPPDSESEEVQLTFARALHQWEAQNEYTVLVVSDPAIDRDWFEFCLRSADRVLLLDSGGSLPQWADNHELGQYERVFVDHRAAIPGRSGHSDQPDPQVRHYVDSGTFEDDLARLSRRVSGRAIGLVLSGGGARGLAHIGVIERLLDAEIPVDVVGGCSMGSFVGAMLGLGWDTARMIDTCRRELVERRPFNDYTIPRVSLIRARKARSMISRTYGEVTFEQLRRPTFVVSADLGSGELVVHSEGPIGIAVGASMAIPGLVPPVSHEGRNLVDGGLLNNLPVDVMRERFSGRTIAVDVLRRSGSGGSSQRPARRGTTVPSIFDTMSRATFLGSQQRAIANRALADVVIEPRVSHLNLFDFARIDEALDAGRRAADAALDDGLIDVVMS